MSISTASPNLIVAANLTSLLQVNDKDVEQYRSLWYSACNGPLGGPCSISCYPLSLPILPGFCFPIQLSMHSDHNILSQIQEYPTSHVCKESFLTKDLSNILCRKLLKPSKRGESKHTWWDSLPAGAIPCGACRGRTMCSSQS